MKLREYYQFLIKNISLIVDFRANNFTKLLHFYKSYREYKKLTEVGLNIADIYPCLYDDTPTTSFDTHYFYQGVWAYQRIKESEIKNHVDVGSDIRWVSLLSVTTKVTFVDIRPPKLELANLIIKKGSVLKMPFETNSIDSLSCLHVAEHIGLGRYGDKLDPEGTKKACHELVRVLSIDGNLYFSIPSGLERICFNAHRIYSPQTIIDYFKGLKLVELSGITDTGEFVENISIDFLEKSKYACGLFWLKKS